MRWLMIALLVSLVALLVASAGVAHHVWREHKKRRQATASSGAPQNESPTPSTIGSSDPETEEAP